MKLVSDRRSEAGNAIVYIFIAIALLAALSFAVSQSSRSAGKGLAEDRASLIASEIIAYGDAVSKATGQLRLRGIKDYQLRFSFMDSPHTDYGTYDDEPRAEIFNPQGGGVLYRQPPVQAGTTPLTYEFTGAFAIDRIGLTGCTAPANQPEDCSELLMTVTGLRKEVCQMINDQLGIANKADEPPQDDAQPDNPRFAGNDNSTPNPYTFTETIGDDSDSALLSQQTAGCYYNGSSYVYYQVLIAR